MIILWNYDVNLLCDQIWNNQTLILQYLKEWLQTQRWAGISIVSDFTLIEKDKFLLFNSNFNKIFGTLLKLYSSNNRKLLNTYFIPLEIVRKTKTIENFPIIIRCPDDTLFLRPAESNELFFHILLKNLHNKSEIKTINSNIIKFRCLSHNFNDNLKIKSIDQLGNGKTTNTLFKIEFYDDSKWVIKIYRIFSQNPEIKMLNKLYSNGFYNVAPPLGYVNIEINEILYPLLLFSKYIETSGDGGLYLWNNLIQQLYSWIPGKILQINSLNNYCDILGKTIADFHYHSSRIKNVFFRPERISQEDILKWLEYIQNLFFQIQKKIKNKFNNKKLQQTLDIIEEHTNLHYKQLLLNKLEGTMKIKIHQDLHLSQMLTVQSDDQIQFILIDFEGDPLLPFKEKFQKDPIFRDLASIFSAFHYIKFNALLNCIEKKMKIEENQFREIYFNSFPRLSHLSNKKVTDTTNTSNSNDFIESHIIQLIQFAVKWEEFCQIKFLESYIHQLKVHNLTFNLDLTNQNDFYYILDFFRIERLVKELYYESIYRKSNIIIPLIGLQEVIRDIN